MTEWHVATPQLEAYRDGSIGSMHAASVEAHLISCARCRQALAAGADAGASERQHRIWARITDEVDRPGPQARFDSVWARSTFGSPPLVGAAVVALLLALAAPMLADALSPRAGVAALLAFAPLAPLLGVVAAFRPSSDPAGEITLATPVATMRLVLLRTLVVAIASIPVGLLAALLLPVRTSLLLGWVLPGLALCAVTLAVGTRVEVGRLAVLAGPGLGGPCVDAGPRHAPRQHHRRPVRLGGQPARGADHIRPRGACGRARARRPARRPRRLE